MIFSWNWPPTLSVEVFIVVLVVSDVVVTFVVVGRIVWVVVGSLQFGIALKRVLSELRSIFTWLKTHLDPLDLDFLEPNQLKHRNQIWHHFWKFRRSHHSRFPCGAHDRQIVTRGRRQMMDFRTFRRKKE